MRLPGILRTWHDDRGYGFIAPTHGGPEIFVHISAFPRDGTRPLAGESVTYELGRGDNGRPQAVRIVRSAIGVGRGGKPPARLSASSSRHGAGYPLFRVLVSVGLVGILGAYAYGRYTGPVAPIASRPGLAIESASPTTPSFRCDGRQHCSQMTSCAEATYFLRHCPGVKMDGNGDGVPCEQQWCR